MVKLNADMKEMFEKAPIYPLTTASKEGEPNVAPMKSVWLVDDETLHICDNYMNKSLANLQENPRAALYFWGPDTKGCVQVKGDVEIRTSGEEYERVKAKMKEKGDKYPAKSLIVLKIKEIYNCAPGEDAGKKLL